MTFKKVLHEIYEANLCSGDAYSLINLSADMDLDNINEHMKNWNLIKNAFYNPTTINLMLNIQDYPIIGSQSKNIICNHICYSYDVVSTYI